jgi:hypothetical protein
MSQIFGTRVAAVSREPAMASAHRVCWQQSAFIRPAARTAARVLVAHSSYKRAEGPALPDGFDSPAFHLGIVLS